MASSRVPAREVKLKNPTTMPNWLELPRDLTLNILRRLPMFDIITNASLVCPLWWNFCKEPCIWRTIHMPDFFHSGYSIADWVKMFQYAVDRSCGQLKDVYICMFGNDELLEYITDRASNLQRVGIESCDELSDKGIIEAVKKLPLIEELIVTKNNNLSKHFFEVVGSCCPLLKTLTYGRNLYQNENMSIDQTEEAFAIAKTMPGLRSLTISGLGLTSVGVVAILDGCPLLESLDLQHCFFMHSEGSLSQSLRERYCEQIKKFIPPIDYCCFDYWCYVYDSDDYHFDFCYDSNFYFD
ncbi:unnamed protein product [Lathyrus sativus]|nr:unnamed protein product [Lathyrus sativus]